jgi:hypothetical protein
MEGKSILKTLMSDIIILFMDHYFTWWATVQCRRWKTVLSLSFPFILFFLLFCCSIFLFLYFFAVLSFSIFPFLSYSFLFCCPSFSFSFLTSLLFYLSLSFFIHFKHFFLLIFGFHSLHLTVCLSFSSA